jgi:MOSC domain-containing protein YiiM
MQLLSVNVGMPREVVGPDRVVMTGIFKSPVADRVRMRTLNLDGDGQADPTVHGGPDKAVYAYPSEHYEFWRTELPETRLDWGAFGENLDTQGLLEDDICIGDELRIGSSRVRVTQPRLPCFKLGIRLQRPDILQRFQASLRTGFYLRVLEEGDVGAGDAIAIVHRDPHRISVATTARLYAHDDGDHEALRSLIGVAALPDKWRERFRRRLLPAG